MNMVLHDCPTAEIWRDNTLSSPHFKNPEGGLKTFDFVVANPPFSDKAWGTGINPANDQFGRFGYGVPPAKNGDYAYLLHVIASLKTNGKGAVMNGPRAHDLRALSFDQIDLAQLDITNSVEVKQVISYASKLIGFTNEELTLGGADFEMYPIPRGA